MFRNHIAGGSNKEKTLEGLTLVLEWQECEPNALCVAFLFIFFWSEHMTNRV